MTWIHQARARGLDGGVGESAGVEGVGWVCMGVVGWGGVGWGGGAPGWGGVGRGGVGCVGELQLANCQRPPT